MDRKPFTFPANVLSLSVLYLSLPHPVNPFTEPVCVDFVSMGSTVMDFLHMLPLVNSRQKQQAEPTNACVVYHHVLFERLPSRSAWDRIKGKAKYVVILR